MYILGIESTCDETAASVVLDGKTVLSNVVFSQIALHSEYGGVVPELACRRHVDAIFPVVQQAIAEAKITLREIDAIAVASGPGLMGALVIGIEFAKALGFSLDIPVIGINHVEAHLYAAMMQSEHLEFPAMGLVLSGGHTTMLRILDIGTYQVIGETIDDAIGEAFDKTAKILGLPYPGGPQIEVLAKNGNPNRYPFKPGKIKNSPMDFSFSGLKTSVLYAVRSNFLNKDHTSLTLEEKQDIAASFQRAAIQDVVEKILKSRELYPLGKIYIGGGVTANNALRSQIETNFPNQVIWADRSLMLDNAAMIAGLGFHKPHLKNTYIDPQTRIAFER